MRRDDAVVLAGARPSGRPVRPRGPDAYAVEPRGEYFIGLIEPAAASGRTWPGPGRRSTQATYRRLGSVRSACGPGRGRRRVAVPDARRSRPERQTVGRALARVSRSGGAQIARWPPRSPACTGVAPNGDDALARDTALLELLTALAARSPMRAPTSGRSAAVARAVRRSPRVPARQRDPQREPRRVGRAVAAVSRTSRAVVPRGRSACRRTATRSACGWPGAPDARTRPRAPAIAASGSGFHDQSHLHRHFVRNFGLTPGAYATAAVSTSKDVQDRG